jgi:hypothetical protein
LAHGTGSSSSGGGNVHGISIHHRIQKHEGKETEKEEEEEGYDCSSYMAKIEIPEEAMLLYQRVDIFLRQKSSLELIVDLYNQIYATLLPVEKPLIKHLLDKMEMILKSHGIDAFLKEAHTDVQETNLILKNFKNHQQKIQQLILNWQNTNVSNSTSSSFLFERFSSSKPLSLVEFEENHRVFCVQNIIYLKKMDSKFINC